VWPAKLIYLVIASLDGYIEDATGTIGWAALSRVHAKRVPDPAEIHPELDLYRLLRLVVCRPLGLTRSIPAWSHDARSTNLELVITMPHTLKEPSASLPLLTRHSSFRAGL
jgi:hypothetical protein